jgi:hypothetical protein
VVRVLNNLRTLLAPQAAPGHIAGSREGRAGLGDVNDIIGATPAMHDLLTADASQ